MSQAISQAIHRLANGHQGVVTSVACAGTALEATTFNVGTKAFLFLRTVEGGQEIRLKLGDSRGELERLGEQWPASYSIGSSGWAKVIVSEERSLDLVEKWIGESYALIGGKLAKPGAAKKAVSKKPAAKKVAAKKAVAKKPTAKKKPAKKKR